MKKLFFVLILFSSLPIMADEYCFELSDREVKIIEDSVLDFEEWINQVIESKIESSSERLMDKEIKKSMEENRPISPNKDQIIDQRLNHPDYKSRKQRIMDARPN